MGGHSGLINWQTDRDEKSHLGTVWIRDRNGRWGERGNGRRWGTQKKKTLRIMVRKRKEEQEQDDITHSEMGVMTETRRKKKPSVRISAILLMRWCCVVLVFQPLRCGHLCRRRLLRASGHKACWNIHSSAVMVRVQVWKLALRSKGGPFTVTLETSSGLWSYFVLCCLPESFLYDRSGKWWGEGGKD